MPTESQPRARRARRLMTLIVPILVLSACGGSAVASTTPVASIAAASPTPVVTVTPTATPAPTATAPSPTAKPLPTGLPITAAAQKALTAYAAAIADKDASYHMDQAAEATIDGASTGTLTYALDVSGSDVSASIDALGNTVKLIALGNDMWTRLGAEDWKKGARDDAAIADVISGFRYGGDPEDLVFLETIAADGGSHHRFSIAAPLPYQTGAMKDSGIVGSVTWYELLIDDAGAPVSITLRTTAEAPVSGQTRVVETDSRIEVSRFGDKITIKAPE